MKKVTMLLLALACLAFLCGSQTSCSLAAIHAARGVNLGGLLPGLEEGKERKPNPAYYLLLPLTLPADVVFLPILIPLIGLAIAHGK